MANITVHVEGIVCLRGTQPGLYAPQYFNSVTDLISAMRETDALLYGWYSTSDHSPTMIVLDSMQFVRSLRGLAGMIKMGNPIEFTFPKFSNEADINPGWVVEHPDVPPEMAWITPTTKGRIDKLRLRYLVRRDSTAPRYISLNSDAGRVTLMNHATNIDDLVLYQTSGWFNQTTSLYFVNGLCCFPTHSVNENLGLVTRLTDGSRYLRNQTDRNRGIVVVDFDGQCKVDCVKLSDLPGTIDNLSTNKLFDSEKSYLLVIDGRLYLPEEFQLMGNNILKFDSDSYKPEMILDRKCCSNEFDNLITAKALDGSYTGKAISHSRSITADSIDLKEARNSFLIILDRKGLKVVKHTSTSVVNDTQFIDEPQTMSNIFSVEFPSMARGLLFDEVTKSVIDYTADQHDQTFWVPGEPDLRKFGCVRALIYPDKPLELCASNNNDMSANASMHDRRDTRGSATVLWPRYSMLDFIFEG